MKRDNKRGQEVKSRFFMPSPKRAQSKKLEIFSLHSQKRAQEEIIGFALIIIIVAVILLVFLSISLNKDSKESAESYEVENYIQSFLQYTSECQEGGEFISIQDLVFECEEKRACSDGRKSCEVLNSTLMEISESSWAVVEGETAIKGYEMEIISTEEGLIYFSKGNLTGNSKGASQEFSKSGTLISIQFTVYA